MPTAVYGYLRLSTAVYGYYTAVYGYLRLSTVDLRLTTDILRLKSSVENARYTRHFLASQKFEICAAIYGCPRLPTDAVTTAHVSPGSPAAFVRLVNRVHRSPVPRKCESSIRLIQ